MQDYTEECRGDLEQKKQAPATVDELRQLFCKSCRNLGCDQIETGPNDPMGKRARLQELRLLHPTIVDPKLPKFAPLAQQDFADAKEAAEAWDIKKPAPAVADWGAAPVSPELMAQRGTAPRKVLRDLPASLNTAPPELAAPGRPALGRDPWNPAAGGMVVGSGATVRLGGGSPADPKR